MTEIKTEDVPTITPAIRGVKRPRSEEAKPFTKPKLVLIHSDALINGRKGLTHTITAVIDIMKNQKVPVFDHEVTRILTNSSSLIDVYRYYVDDGVFDSEFKGWYKRHKSIMNKKGYQMLKPHPGARELLQLLMRRGIPVIIMTSNDEVLQTFLDKFSLRDLVAKVIDGAHLFAHEADGLQRVLQMAISPLYAQIKAVKPKGIKPVKSVVARARTAAVFMKRPCRVKTEAKPKEVLKIKTEPSDASMLDVDMIKFEVDDAKPEATLAKAKSLPIKSEASSSHPEADRPTNIGVKIEQEVEDTEMKTSSVAQSCQLYPEDVLFVFSARYNQSIVGRSNVKTYWVRQFETDDKGRSAVDAGNIDIVIDSLDELRQKVAWAKDVEIKKEEGDVASRLGGSQGSNASQQASNSQKSNLSQQAGLSSQGSASSQKQGESDASQKTKAEVEEDRIVICLD